MSVCAGGQAGIEGGQQASRADAADNDEAMDGNSEGGEDGDDEDGSSSDVDEDVEAAYYD